MSSKERLTKHQSYFRRFRDMKSLSSRQVCGAHKLSRYHFRIDYQLGSPCQSASLVPLLWVSLHQVIICKTQVIPLLNFGDVLQNETSKPGSRAEILDELGGCRRSCALPRPVLRSWDYQDWANYRENSRTRCQEILWRHEVTPNTYSLSMDFVTRLPIFTVWKGDSYDSIKELIKGFCDGIAYIYGFEGRQLWFDPHHC